MDTIVLSNIKTILLNQVDYTVWRYFRQTLAEIVNEVQIRKMIVSQNFSADEIFGLLKQEGILLRVPGQHANDLRDAIDRLLKGTYGLCQHCGQVIDESEVLNNPTARYCGKCPKMDERSCTTVIGAMNSVNSM